MFKDNVIRKNLIIAICALFVSGYQVAESYSNIDTENFLESMEQRAFLPQTVSEGVDANGTDDGSSEQYDARGYPSEDQQI